MERMLNSYLKHSLITFLTVKQLEYEQQNRITIDFCLVPMVAFSPRDENKGERKRR